MADEYDIYVMKSKLDKAEKELAEVKKLLNLALEDMHKIVIEYTGCEGLCEFCQKNPKQCQNGLIWRYCAKLYPFIGDMVNMED